MVIYKRRSWQHYFVDISYTKHLRYRNLNAKRLKLSIVINIVLFFQMFFFIAVGTNQVYVLLLI